MHGLVRLVSSFWSQMELAVERPRNMTAFRAEDGPSAGAADDTGADDVQLSEWTALKACVAAGVLQVVQRR